MAKKVNVQKVSDSAPMGVKILSVLAYLGAAFTVLFGVMMMAGSALFGGFLRMMPGYSAMAGLGAGIFIVMGLVMIAGGILDYFIGKGLWDGKNWARILLLVFAVLGVLGSITSFNLVNLVISGVIIWYLGFNKEAIAYFK